MMSFTNYEVKLIIDIIPVDQKGRFVSGNKEFISTYLSIFKCDDGWFYLSTIHPKKRDFTYFKCDQIDGLIDCLKNEFSWESF